MELEKPVEKSHEYQLARLEMTIENLHQEIAALKLDLAKSNSLNEKWKALVTLNLKIREARETLYTVHEMLDVVQTKLNN